MNKIQSRSVSTKFSKSLVFRLKYFFFIILTMSLEKLELSVFKDVETTLETTKITSSYRSEKSIADHIMQTDRLNTKQKKIITELIQGSFVRDVLVIRTGIPRTTIYEHSRPLVKDGIISIKDIPKAHVRGRREKKYCLNFQNLTEFIN